MQAVQRVSAQVATGAPHLGSAPVKCAFKCGVQRAGRVIRAQATAVEGQQAVDQAPVKPERTPLDMEEQGSLVLKGSTPKEQAKLLKLPKGYHWYETMLIMNPVLNDNERDQELAKFEAFLNREECLDITALIRNRSRLAFQIRKQAEGVYVLYTYAARRQTARDVQKLLSTPVSGSEDNILRHITFCKY